MDNLTATTLFKVHAIEARWDQDGYSAPLNDGWAQYIGIVNFIYKKGLALVNSTINVILGDTTSDLVVPRYSQLGGLTDVLTYDHYDFTTHSSIFPTTINGWHTDTDNPLIQKRVAELLLSDNASDFASGFPAPNKVAQPNTFSVKPNHNGIGTFGTPVVDSTNTNELVLTSPTANDTVSSNGNDSLTLRFTFTDSTNLVNAFFVVSGSTGFITAPSKPPFMVKVAIPKDTVPSRLSVVAMCNDINGTVYADTLSVATSYTSPFALDSLALVALYDSTNGPNWTNHTNWLTTAPLSTWYGITVTGGRVTSIIDSFNNLIGTIPSAIGNLTELQYLRLNTNKLSGAIPLSIGNLTDLNYLYLGANQLSGTIPDTIGGLGNLQRLELDSNLLSGSIPTSIFNLTNLVHLFLDHNQLTGTIPTSLGSLTNLTELSLDVNQLSGTIPSTIGSLTKLTYLSLYNNQLSGSIPTSIGSLTNLDSLYLYSNQLTGTIPSNIGNLTKLAKLSLQDNQLSGTIPTSIGNLTKLTTLYLYSNQLTGTIPSSIGNLTNLTQLELGANQLSGTIPSSIGNLTNLTELTMSSTKLSGSVPSSLTNLTKLSTLKLNSDSLTFSGMEAIAKMSISSKTYAPQAGVPLYQTGNELSVSVGGTPSNNTFKWYNGSTNNLVATIVGDSTYTPTIAGQYFVVATNSVATALTLHSDTIVLYTWTGATSTNWSVASNWSNGLLPTATSTVSIPSTAANQPVLSAATTVNGISVNGSLTLNGYTLTIDSAVTGTGYLRGSSASSLVIAGNAGTISFDPNYNTLQNLTITGTASLGNALNITGIFTPTSGTFNTNNLLTLKSTSIANTAVVGVVGGTVTGTATVERYIPSGLRTYRDIGANGVANAGSIFTNWQEGGVNTNGYGIQITGAKGTTVGYDPTTGLDWSLTGNHSLYTYINNIWDSVTTTKGTTLVPYQGYRVLVRGNRTGSLQTQLPYMWSPATIRATGNLVTGTVTFGTSGTNGNYPSSYGLMSGGSNAYSFIANPYACVVDWDAVYAGSQNMNGSYWYCDPTFLVDGYQVFVVYNAVAQSSNNPLSQIGRYLQPGQAFFVENGSSGTPQLVFNESDKAPTQSKTAIFGTATPVNRIAVGLYKNGTNIDGAVTVFGNSFSKVLGAEDAIKFPNGGENLAFTIAGKDVSINGYPMPIATDVLPIHLYNLQANTTYTMKLDDSQYTGNGVSAYIKDSIANTQTLLGDSSNVTFTTNATDATSYDDRYSIVFGGSALPVKSIKLTATTQDKSVLVNWSTIGETNVANYTVEHSIDGINFTALQTEAAKNTATAAYRFTDYHAAQGINYYRIKVMDNVGSVGYSALATATIAKLPAGIVVYPNPVINNSFSVKLNNLQVGKYTMQVIDKLGQVLLVKSIDHSILTTTESVVLDSHIAAGSYIVRVSSDNSTYQTLIEFQ